MEPSHSETSSEVTPEEYVKQIEDSLNWHAAILTVLLQEAGGKVEINADELSRIDLAKAQSEISFDSERNVYIIEGLYTEDES